MHNNQRRSAFAKQQKVIADYLLGSALMATYELLKESSFALRNLSKTNNATAMLPKAG